MAGTSLGAIRWHSERIGITVEEYLAQVARGLKWCWRCLAWKTREKEFYANAGRKDGLSDRCQECDKREQRRKHPRKRRKRRKKEKS